MRCTSAQLYAGVKTAMKAVRLRRREDSRRTMDLESAESFNRLLARCREVASDVTIYSWPEPVIVVNASMKTGGWVLPSPDGEHYIQRCGFFQWQELGLGWEWA